MPSTAVVVPCYNEAERLDVAAFVRFAEAHPHLRFVMVDDGSRDRTGALLRELHDEQPERFDLLALPENRGKAEAVRAGLVRAFDQGAALAAYWDADLATPLDELLVFERVMREHPECLLVMGARVSLLGRDIRRNVTRHYLGRVFATLAAATLGLPVYDTQCGAKLLRGEPLVREALREPFASRWIFDVELLARLVDACAAHPGLPAAARLREQPLARWHDVAGSRLKPSDFARAAFELAHIARRHR